MFTARNGDAEKCWKQYTRIIKLLTVSWQKASISWRKLVSSKVSIFAVIRGHSVWQECNSTDEQSSARSPIRMKLLTQPLQTAVPSACIHCIWCLCLCTCVYFLTSQWMQSAHVDLLWHVYSRAHMTFVGTMKAHHMRLKQNLPSGSSAIMKLSFKTRWWPTRRYFMLLAQTWLPPVISGPRFLWLRVRSQMGTKEYFEGEHKMRCSFTLKAGSAGLYQLLEKPPLWENFSSANGRQIPRRMAEIAWKRLRRDPDSVVSLAFQCSWQTQEGISLMKTLDCNEDKQLNIPGCSWHTAGMMGEGTLGPSKAINTVIGKVSVINACGTFTCWK